MTRCVVELTGDEDVVMKALRGFVDVAFETGITLSFTLPKEIEKKVEKEGPLIYKALPRLDKDARAKALEKRRARVMKQLQADLSVAETAEKLNMPRSMVYNDMIALRKQGYKV